MTHGTDDPDESPAGAADEAYPSRPGPAHAATDEDYDLGPEPASGRFDWTGAEAGTSSPAALVPEQDPGSGATPFDEDAAPFPTSSYSPEYSGFADEPPSYPPTESAEAPPQWQPYGVAQPPPADAPPVEPQYSQPAYPEQQFGQQQYPSYPAAPQQGPPQGPPQQGPPQQGPPQQGPPQQGGHYAPGYGPAPQQQPPPPPPIPRPEDLLVPDRSPVTDQPASWGWRGRVNRATGGMFKTKAAPAEIAARQDITDIQHSFSRPMTVVVVQPKGGAGKTPTTICLSAAFGAHRGGYVVGWDDNETRGTLAVRVNNPDSQQATVWDLLSDLAAFEGYQARVGDLSHYVRAQPDAHFDALVSDDNPSNMAQIGQNEYERLHAVLQRFYRMIVVDTGNNVRSPNWQAAVNSADMIVVVSTYQRDVGYSGSWVLDHLAQTGREELARNAVTILTAADPTTDKTVRDQLLPHFQARTRAVCEVPYDSELAHGGPIRWAELAPATRNAWVRAGATIVNCLADDDRRALAARSN